MAGACFSVYAHDAEWSGGGGSVARHLLAAFAFRHDAAVVHVVLALAEVACGKSVYGYRERLAAHGYIVGVETVGTLEVVGIERHGTAERAEAYYQSVVETEDQRASLVDGCEH